MKKLITSFMLFVTMGAFSAVDERTYIPPKAFLYNDVIETGLNEVFPLIPGYHYIPALIEHESCQHLLHKRCWDPTSSLKTAREEGAGLGVKMTKNKAEDLVNDNLLKQRKGQTMITYAAIFPNGKRYIGVTTSTLEKRARDHLSHSKSIDNKFYRAIKKYGFDSIEFREVKVSQTKEEMFESEKILIDRHDTIKNGYNTTTGGEGSPGRVCSEEVRKKMSEGQKKRFSDPEQRRKLGELNSKWRLENPEAFEEARQNASASHRTAENRALASIKQKEYNKRNPEALVKMSQRNTELYKSKPEIKAQISKSLGGSPIKVFKNGEQVNVYQTLSELARDMNLSIGNVGMVLNGKRNHTHGYTFERVKEES